MLMLRFSVAEDDADEELVEEHVTKVCERHICCIAAEMPLRFPTVYTTLGVTNKSEVRRHVFRFTTAAVLTPSWPSLSMRFKRVLSARTSVWSRWAHGRYVHKIPS